MLIEDFIINLFCTIDDIYKEITKNNKLRKRGESPKLHDSELITIFIVGEFYGLNHNKVIWKYFNNHWLKFFPNLCGYSSFSKQIANLHQIIIRIQQYLAQKTNSFADKIHICDGLPLKIANINRKYNSFKGEAAIGYCAAKDEKYYGFKGHLIVDSNGIPINYTFTAANIDERDVLAEITGNIQDLLIGDKGYIRPILKEEMANQNIDLQTPLRKNMKDDRPESFVNWICQIRKRIEFTISQLTERFKINCIKAKDLWHFAGKFTRKICAFTAVAFLNGKVNPENMCKFDLLVE